MQRARQRAYPAADIPQVDQHACKKHGDSSRTRASEGTPADKSEQDVDVREKQYEWYWSW